VEAIAEACAGDPWLSGHPARIEWWGGQFASGETESTEPILDAVRRSHAAVSDRPQGTWGTPYGSDLRLMRHLGGVPTVHYGPGDAQLAHGPNESVPVPELLTAARALAVTALAVTTAGDSTR
jgi:acetylornithine deacetylase